MAWETWVQSQVESFQRLKKWYLMPACLTLNIIRYGSRVKWSNLWKGVAPPIHLGVVAIEKGAFKPPSSMATNFTFTYSEDVPLLQLVYCQILILFIYFKIYIYLLNTDALSAGLRIR